MKNMLALIKAYFVIILLFFIVTPNITAQKDTPFDKKHIKPKTTYKAVMDSMNEGDILFNLEMYKQALKFYNYPQEVNPNNSNLNFKIGICYLNGPHKDKARPYFENAFNLENKINDDIYYYLGRSYHYEGNWEKAKESYGKYNRSKFQKEAEKHIVECDRAIEFSKTPVEVNIKNVGPKVNTKFAEYSAIISADGSVMYFTARRNTTTGKAIDQSINDWKEDVYKSEFIDGEWTESENVGRPVNSEGHDAMVSLSADGQTLFIYKDENNNGGDLYVCSLEGNDWSYPTPLNKNINTKHHETSISLSADEKTLYFVTSKPGGYGGSDIYKATLNENGDWDNVENLGNVINTAENEESVFIHPDGKSLYFSSQGHNTIGGYDVFLSTLVNGEWSTPVNMGIPINTGDDDVFFVLDASGKNGYYTSGKIGGQGEKDIYLLEFPEEKSVALLKGTVTEENGDNVATDIKIYNNITDELILTIPTNSSSGEYLTTLEINKEYRIELSYKDYPSFSETINIANIEGYQEFVKNYQFKYPSTEDTVAIVDTPEVTIAKPGYVYTLQFFATIEKEKAEHNKRMIENAGVEGVYIQKVIFTDTDEINYRVRSGRYNSLEEAQLDGNKIDLNKLPEKGFWIDNVREEDYSVKKMEYDIME